VKASTKELKSLGCRPSEPRKSKWPAYGAWRENPENDTPSGKAYTNGRYDVVYAVVAVEHPDYGALQCIRLQVCNWDQSAQHDWRDFQRIKNDLVGEDWEAVELYPAEARLLDPSNAFYLWCYPPGILSWVGLQNGRSVIEPERAIAPQRDFEAALTKAQD
jgi:hypothetical protein